VLPILEVGVIEVPFNTSSPSSEDPLPLTLLENEGFQWPCSVMAGEGDQLQWLLNGELIPSLNESFVVEVEAVSVICSGRWSPQYWLQ
jgi:hypothetical protein